jgi:hypothetical protein
MKTLIPFGLIAVTAWIVSGSVGQLFAQVRNNPPARPLVGPNAQVGAPGVQVNTPGVGVNIDIPQTPWFNSPSIRQQLKLDERQYNQLNQSYNQYWNRYNQGVSRLGTDLTPEQREARIRDYYGTFHNDFDRSRNEVLTNPELQRRYNQLYWQYQGYGAFNDPAVQQKLELNDVQRQALQRYDHDANRELRTLRQEYGNNREAVAKQFAQWRAQTSERINSTLAPQQQQAWKEMTGERYEFHADDYLGSNQTQPIRNP